MDLIRDLYFLPTIIFLSLSIGVLFYAWRYRRPKSPLERDKVFEAMMDPIVVLDNKKMVADINVAMLTLLDKSASDVIGKPAKEVFVDFPIPIKMYTDVSYARAEAAFEISGKNIYYELTVWPFYNSRHKIIGRIYISHDITALKELEQKLRELNLDLEKRVRAGIHELAEAYDTTLEGWAKTLEFRDKETEGHSRRVTEITLRIARTLEIPEDELIQIRRGALLHDIGKMSISDDILRKTGILTAAERAIMQEHPAIAYQLLERIPYLHKALEIPYCHHEKWDGSGYPRGLKHRAIPLSARIFAIVDVWDAIQSDRPYKKSWSKEEAAAYIKQESGKHFDPRIADVFLRLLEKDEI